MAARRTRAWRLAAAVALNGSLATETIDGEALACVACGERARTLNG